MRAYAASRSGQITDYFTSQFLFLATGIFHQPRIPSIPGNENFKRDQFHSGRWDYQVTGGDALGTRPMGKLSLKTVGIIGTGASAV